MADYTRDIGGGTTLMIRDTGGNVEFWIKTGVSTWNNEQPWSYGANGGNTPTLYFRLLRGGNWQQMGSVYVGYDQDVRFSIVNSGVGFPSYDFVQHIQRTTVPGAPFIWETVALSSTQIRVQFNDGYDGGSAIVNRQIGYGGNPNSPEFYWVATGGSTTLGPFVPGSRVFFWARTGNVIGFGDWSNRTEATTWRVPDPPQTVETSNPTQVSISTKIRDNFNGGTSIVERELRYGTDPTTPQVIVSGPDIDRVLTGLDPGKTYYFWSRVRNAVGWSPVSERMNTNLIAGAQVLYGGVWSRAVPYVKTGGVWRVARPWVRNAGEWKETSG